MLSLAFHDEDTFERLSPLQANVCRRCFPVSNQRLLFYHCIVCFIPTWGSCGPCSLKIFASTDTEEHSFLSLLSTENISPQMLSSSAGSRTYVKLANDMNYSLAGFVYVDSRGSWSSPSEISVGINYLYSKSNNFPTEVLKLSDNGVAKFSGIKLPNITSEDYISFYVWEGNCANRICTYENWLYFDNYPVNCK